MPTFGVDEAGRGPALGSMFAAAVCVPDEAILPDGLDDSKRLSPERRERLAVALRADERVAIGVAEVPPARIDDPTTDMNTLTVDAHATAIDEAVARVGDATFDGLCDACDTDERRFARRVSDATTADVEVDARHGADGEDPLVSAASIVAKVERDAQMAAYAASFDAYGPVGSGYPSDPKTKAFLERYLDDVGDLPPFARRSWGTCTDLLAAAEQSSFDAF